MPDLADSFMNPTNCARPDIFLPPETLPMLGTITEGEKDYLGKFRASVSGRDVLCIGYSEPQIEAYVMKLNPRSVTCLAYWAGHADASVTKYPLVLGDITKQTDFADDRFDSVISLATLEHLSNVESGLQEMKRITRSGGDVLVQFGPAWSCAYGHHIYERPRDALLDFSVWKMPAFLHLLCRPKDIVRFYVDNGYEHKDGLGSLYWFYENTDINRLMYDDYLTLFFKHFQVQVIDHMCLSIPANLLDVLRRKYEPYLDFSTYGGKYWLKVFK